MTSTENDNGYNQQWNREKRERIAIRTEDVGVVVSHYDYIHNDGDDHHFNKPTNNAVSALDSNTNGSNRNHICNHNMMCDRNTTMHFHNSNFFIWLDREPIGNQVSAVEASNVGKRCMRMFIAKCQRDVAAKWTKRIAALQAMIVHDQDFECAVTLSLIGRRAIEKKSKTTISTGHINSSRATVTFCAPTPTKSNNPFRSYQNLQKQQQQQPKTLQRNSDGASYSIRHSQRPQPRFAASAACAADAATATGGAASLVRFRSIVDVFDDDNVYPSSQPSCVVVKRHSSRQRSTFSCLNELVKMYSARVKHIKKQLAAANAASADRISADCGSSTELNLLNCVDGHVVVSDLASNDYTDDNDVLHGSGHQDRHHQKPGCDVSCHQCSDSDKARRGNKVTTNIEAPRRDTASTMIENKSNIMCRCGSDRPCLSDNDKCKPTYNHRDVDTIVKRVCSDYDEVDNSSKIRHDVQGVPGDSVVGAASVQTPQYKFTGSKCNLCHTIVSVQSVKTKTTVMHSKGGNNQYFSGERRHSEHTSHENELLGSMNTNQLHIQCGDRLAMSCSPTSDEGCPNHVSPYSSSSEDEDKAKGRRNFEQKREKVARSSSSDSALGLDEDGLGDGSRRPTRRMTLTIMDLPLRPALLPVAEPTNLSDSQPQLTNSVESPTNVPSKLLLEAQIIEISSIETSPDIRRRSSRPDAQSADTDNTSDQSPGPIRFVRTPSVVVSDYSDDLMCGGITLEEIEFFRYQRQMQRRSSAQAAGVDYDSDLSTSSSCSNLNYCGSTISAMDAEEMYMPTASGLLTPERKISDCSTCSTVSGEMDTFPIRLTEALKEQKKKVGGRFENVG